MSKSTIIECALDGEIHKIHEIQINRTHPMALVHVRVPAHVRVGARRVVVASWTAT